MYRSHGDIPFFPLFSEMVKPNMQLSCIPSPYVLYSQLISDPVRSVLGGNRLSPRAVKGCQSWTLKSDCGDDSGTWMIRWRGWGGARVFVRLGRTSDLCVSRPPMWIACSQSRKVGKKKRCQSYCWKNRWKRIILGSPSSSKKFQRVSGEFGENLLTWRSKIKSLQGGV